MTSKRAAAITAIIAGVLLVVASALSFGLVGGLYAAGFLLLAAAISNL